MLLPAVLSFFNVQRSLSPIAFFFSFILHQCRERRKKMLPSFTWPRPCCFRRPEMERSETTLPVVGNEKKNALAAVEVFFIERPTVFGVTVRSRYVAGFTACSPLVSLVPFSSFFSCPQSARTEGNPPPEKEKKSNDKRTKKTSHRPGPGRSGEEEDK